jgi:hypothetical protein
VDEPFTGEDLRDDVTDEEAAESPIDFQQLRVILERTSQFPSERWIPPASVASNPAPAGARKANPVASARQLGLLGAGLLVAIAAVMLCLRERQRPHKVPASWSTLASSAVRESSTASAATTPKVSTPAVEPRADTTHLDTQSESATPTASFSNGAESDVMKSNSEPVVITEGLLDARLFLSKLKQALPVFDEQCWAPLRVSARETPKHPSLQVILRIDCTGHVREIESGKSPPGYWGVGHCIVGRMRGWKFPAATEETRAVIRVERARK